MSQTGERSFWVAVRRALIIVIEAIEERYELEPYKDRERRRERAEVR